MSGDLDQFIEEGSLSDLDEWYDDPEGLTPGKDRLEPEQNLQAIPELQEQWADRDDKDFHLSPRNRDVSREEGKSPFHTEVETELPEERVDEVVDKAKRELQSSSDPRKTIDTIASTFSREAIEAAAGRLKDVLSEAGLLGNVYVDANLYPECHNGQGKDEVRSNCTEAKYVVGKEECGDCVHNHDGRCSVFDKEIVFDIPYDQPLWEDYASLLRAQGLDLNKVSSDASPKEKIRQAYLTAQSRKQRPPTKPVYEDPANKVSYDEAWEIIKEADVGQEVVEDPRRKKKVEEYGRRMSLGDHTPELKRHVHADDDLAVLRPHLNLLGRLYLAKEFTDEELERDILSKRPSMEGRPVVSIQDPSHLKQPEVLNQIVRRIAILQGIHPDREAEKFASTQKQLLGKLRSLPNDKLRAAAKELFSQPLQAKAPSYDGSERLPHEEKDVSTDEALKELAEASQDNTVPDYAIWIKEGGQELLDSLRNRIGRSAVRLIDKIHRGEIGRSPVASEDYEDTLRYAAKTATVDNFEPQGTQPPAPSHFDTKVGRKLNQEMIAGKTDAELADTIRHSFSEEEILQNLPVIYAFREQEGLYGQVYTTADGFVDCRKGSKKVDPDVDQIVKRSKCEGCVYNKIGKCRLYGKDLVEQPQYDRDLALKYLNKAVNDGRMTEASARELLQSDTTYREMIRASNRARGGIGIQKVQGNQRTEGNFQAHRGYSQHQVQQASYQQKREIVAAAKQKLSEGYYGEDLVEILRQNFGRELLVQALEDVHAELSEIDEEWYQTEKGSKSLSVDIQDSTGAESELSTMNEMELGGGVANDPMGSFDLTPQSETEKEGEIDIELDDSLQF